MQRSFHNTISVCGEQLDLYEKKAVAQEDRILLFMATNKGRWFSSVDIKSRVFNGNIGPQSLSRALANLKNTKKIIKSESTMFQGEYDRPVHGWRYNVAGGSPHISP